MSGSPSAYVGLLRGVNVGGNNKLPMAELRLLCEKLGFNSVRTFIQSGNVIFLSEKAPDAAVIEAAIKEQFAIKTDVIVRSAKQLRLAVQRNPFSHHEGARVHVGFMAKAPSQAVIRTLDHEQFVSDEFLVKGAEVYLSLPTGVGQSKLPTYLVRQLKVPVTLRNWNTVKKLVELTAN